MEFDGQTMEFDFSVLTVNRILLLPEILKFTFCSYVICEMETVSCEETTYRIQPTFQSAHR